MKKVFFFFFLLSSILLSAKKVKFAVDMSGQIINATGIHVSGDFQAAAGFPGGDWTSNTLLNRETNDTNIYSIIVDIPAFRKYEYKFMNGDQFYEAEFVPLESRVGYNFNDNRWIYIDSLANDTTFVGAIRFACNAPKNKKLVRFYVDMTNFSVSVNGVHIAGDFQGWSTVNTILYNFDNSSIYEMICYVDSLSSYEYKFYNGNTTASTEIVPSSCALNNNRYFTSLSDTLMPIVCFSSCSDCSTTGIENEKKASKFQIVPNPTSSYSELTIENPENVKEIVMFDYTGRMIRKYDNVAENKIILEKNQLDAGVYLVKFSDYEKQSKTIKWVIE